MQPGTNHLQTLQTNSMGKIAESGPGESSPFEDRDSRFQNGEAERRDMGRESNNDAMICVKKTQCRIGSSVVYLHSRIRFIHQALSLVTLW